MTSSALQSRKWQLNGMSQWCRSALCGHPLSALTDSWTHGAASRHTIAPISNIRPSPRSRSYYSFPVPLRVEPATSRLPVRYSTNWTTAPTGQRGIRKFRLGGRGVDQSHPLSCLPLLACPYPSPKIQVWVSCGYFRLRLSPVE